MKVNKIKNIFAGISTLFLFGALLEGWPYGYFTLLRFIVCISSGYIAFKAYEFGKEFWVYSFGFLAILFNPILPVHLTRDIWVLIDFASGIFMIISIFKLKLENKNE